eukprot:404940-Prymnesium_polylepis.1
MRNAPPNDPALELTTDTLLSVHSVSGGTCRVPPLTREKPLARVSECSLSLTPLLTSNICARCWASIVAPSFSDAITQSIERSTMIGEPSSTNLTPGGKKSEMAPNAAVAAIAPRIWATVTTVMKPMGPGMSGGIGGGKGGTGGAGGAGDGVQPGTKTPASTQERGHSVKSGSLFEPGTTKGTGQPACLARVSYVATLSLHAAATPPTYGPMAISPVVQSSPPPRQIAIDAKRVVCAISTHSANGNPAGGGELGDHLRVSLVVLSVIFELLVALDLLEPAPVTFFACIAVTANCRKCAFGTPSASKPTSSPAMILLTVDMCK